MPKYTSMKSESLPFATNYNGDATLSPDKELNAIVKTANSVLTLDKGPYNGYSLPITSYVEPVFVKFQNLFNETVLIALSKNQTVNFIYRDDQFNPVSNSPVSCWYIESGVLFKTTSNYLDTAPYIDPDNPSQGRFKPNDWRLFIGLGSYTFSYSGSSQSLTSVYDLPEETGLSTAVANAYYITKQNYYISRGVATAQRWAHGNENPNTVPIWTARLHDDVAPYEWDSWHPTSTDDGQGTLENKNFDFKDNIVKNTPVTLTDATITYNFTKETDILLNTNNMVLTLGTAPYTGFTVQVSSNRGIGEWVYVLMPYGGSNHCIALTYTNRVYFEYCNGVGWLLRNGQALATTTAAITNAPSGYSPNDWQTYKGAGNITYSYDLTSDVASYKLPGTSCEINTNWFNGTKATASAYSHTTDRSIFTKKFDQTWDSNWISLTANNVTANKVIVSDANGKIIASNYEIEQMNVTFTDNSQSTYYILKVPSA